MKRKLTQAEYDKLDAKIKTEYEAGDKDGEFVLKLEDDDAPALLRARDREKAQKDKAVADLKKAEDRNAELETELVAARDPKKAQDIATIERSWQKKLDTATTEHTAKLSARDAFITKTMRDNVAATMAKEISTVPSLMSKAIADRIAIDLSGDEPRTVVLDKTGKASDTMTLEKLREEFVANKEFSSIIVASKASGGGAPKSTLPSAGSAARSPDNQPPSLATMAPADLAASIAARREAKG